MNMGYYDPETARFLQEDTYRGNAGDPLSLNLYAYCKYNPLKYTDPTGHIVSETDKANLSPAQQAELQKCTDAWNAANKAYNSATTQAQKDKAAADMKAANDKANAIRASANYSGGSNGDSITVNSGKTVETVVVSKTTTVTNNGTITNLNVNNGVTTSITNNGTITTLTNNGTITTIDNTGKINTVVNNGSIGTITNTGTIGTITNNTSSSSIKTITNTGTIDTINSYNGSITTINNTSRITGDITTGANCNTTINNAGFIGGISIRENSSVTVNNAAYISRLNVWKNGVLDGNNAGEVGYQYIFDGGKATNKWTTTSEAPIYFIDNEFVWYIIGLTEADRNAGVGISRVNGKFYRDISVPVTNALKRDEGEFEKHQFDLGWFGKQVGDNGPWNLKYRNGDDNKWESTLGISFWGYQTEMVLNGMIVKVEDVGNITYGYLGAAAMIFEIIQKAGSAANHFKNHGFSDWENEFADQAWFRVGVEWYIDTHPIK